ARGDDHCQWEVRWKNPSFGARFWAPAAGGIAASGALGALLATTAALPWPATAGLVALPALCGGALGYALLQHHRRGHFQGLLKVQADEIVYSSLELEKKFRDLGTKVEQLSMLSDLSAAVNATLDPERIYQQALDQLVHRMGYQGVYFFLVDRERQRIVGHKGIGGRAGVEFEKIDLPLDARASVAAKVAATGVAVLVED